MKTYSNIPIPDTLVWKGTQKFIAINHRQNTVTSEEDEGKRYEADFTVADSESEIIDSAQRMLQDEELDNKFIWGFSKEKKVYPPELPKIESAEILFNADFIKSADLIQTNNSDADSNVINLAGKVKNYVCDLTDGTRTASTDEQVAELIADGNIIITNQ